MKKPKNIADQAAGAGVAEAPAAEQVGEQAPKRLVRPIDGARFRGREYMRSEWMVTVFAGTNPEDLLKPEYWAQVSAQLKPRDRIEAWADDGSWLAEYVVLESGRNWSRAHLLSVAHFTSGDIAQTQADAMSPYEITHRGPHSKWSVIRKTDRAVMTEGHETARGAAEWLTERMKAGV